MKIGITCYPTYGGSGVVATELGIELAARGHQVHFITYSQPFRRRSRRRHFLSQSAGLELPPLRVPALTSPWLRACPRWLNITSSTCCTFITPSPTPCVRCLPARCWPSATGYCPLSPRSTYRHYPGRARPVILPITRFAIEESDGVTSISSYLRKNRARLRHRAADRGHSQLRQLRRVQTPGRPARRRSGALRRPGRKDPAPSLKLPSGQAHPRRHRGLLPHRSSHAARLSMVGDGPTAPPQSGWSTARVFKPGPISRQTGAGA